MADHNQVRFFRISDKCAASPSLSVVGSAGYDLRVPPDEDYTIYPHDNLMIDTGWGVEIPNGYVGLLAIRSGLAMNYGLTLVNGVGVIDSGYHGPLKVLVRNTGTETAYLSGGARFCQIMFLPLFTGAVCVETLGYRPEKSERDTGGFGSTGQ